ncbi:MAG: [protein-PII] uridylyltransferase, partial [Pikeienuella sp.]
RDGRIDVKDEQFILSDPCNILRLFTEGLRSGALIHPNAFRMVARHLGLIDDKLRADPEASKLMLDLIVQSDDPERALRRMNEIGVLGAFIPEFDPIVSLMQFNMYHHYTVDEHTINAIGGLKKLENGGLIEDLPVASDIIATGVDMTVLYMAVLLHDIGKGRLEAHEEVGADIATRVCPNLGLNEGQTELVEWLVRNHLVMSDVAQKRDISDPATIKAFAEQVRSVKRLKLLLVLTALDIRAVGPGTWNNWKAQLLRTLYADTLAELTPGVEHSSRSQRAEEAQEILREKLVDWSREDVDSWVARHYQPYWLGLSADIHEQFARMSVSAEPDKLHSSFKRDEERDVTQCCFYVADHPGIFSRMAGALALAGASVVDARTFTDNSGMASTFFSIQDSEGRPIEEDRHDRLKRSIHRTLRGDIIARDALRSRRKVKRRERPFDVPTTITFDNEGSDLYTVIEVDTRDRIGLLYDLTRTMTGVGVNIASAVITTYGEQAVDSFYVKDVFGFKIKDKKKQKTIEDKLRAAITRARTEALEQA